jgi:hypothetical protein
LGGIKTTGLSKFVSCLLVITDFQHPAMRLAWAMTSSCE